MSGRAGDRWAHHLRARNGPGDPAREKYFAAARAVAARDGVRGVTIKAIADEARLAVGTVGTVRIDEYLDDIVFTALLELILVIENLPGKDGIDFEIRQQIDHLFGQQPDLPSLVVQAAALAGAAKGMTSSGVLPGEISFVINTVQRAQQLMTETLVEKHRVSPPLASTTTINAIKAYFEQAFVKTVLEPAIPPARRS